MHVDVSKSWADGEGGGEPVRRQGSIRAQLYIQWEMATVVKKRSSSSCKAGISHKIGTVACTANNDLHTSRRVCATPFNQVLLACLLARRIEKNGLTSQPVVQRSAAQHGTAQRSAGQRSTAQHSKAKQPSSAD